MEGGAMRGMFTAGVTDVMMENGIKVDGAIGVSAGAVFGCNYKSNQIGRAIRYNMKYCKNPRYASFLSLITTGDFYGEKFCYHDLPEKLDVFDTETFKNSEMEFYSVCTDLKTGKPVYTKCETGGGDDLQWLRASASMPLAARIVKIGSGRYLDGGIADSVPLKYFESIGYTKNIVILTQPDGYIKEINGFLPMIKIVYRKYPEFVNAVKIRHDVYNKTIEYIRKKEEEGSVFVVRPPQALGVGAYERNPANLKRVYDLGRKVAEEKLEKMKGFLKGE